MKLTKSSDFLHDTETECANTTLGYRGFNRQVATTMELPPLSHFVFVHGAMHGAWCWYKIRTHLEAQGYKVSCLDLASAGIDRSDPDTIFELEEYDKPLIEFMLKLPENEKVIVVGHSAGGLSVTHLIQEFGNKIHLAIYVCGSMLPMGANKRLTDKFEYGYGLGPDEPPTSAILKKEIQHQILYHLSPMEDSTLASMLLKPFPLLATSNAMFNPGGDMDKVKRVFIKTMHDQMLNPEIQEEMIKKWPPSKVLSIESDHSPFFSAPTQLVDLLFQAMA